VKAIVHHRYGRPGVLELRDVDVPLVEGDQVLVRVRASSVNPVDWYGVTGFFPARIGNGLRTPKHGGAGSDLAGVVEAVGSDVAELRPGDEVYGTSDGAWAEYAVSPEGRLASKPSNLSFEEAAAVPVAAITSLQALRDKGGVRPGHKVLINGASGGVGTFAVQIAKAFGAEVAAVCSTGNVDLIRSLGADHVVDYTQEDFTKLGSRHDVMLDISGRRPFRHFRRVLKPEATVVLIGGRMTYRRLGPLPHLVGAYVASRGRSQTVTVFVAKITTADLAALRELIEAGTVTPVIDRRYQLGRAAEALRYLGEGHARGKVVLSVPGRV
jgi:NADPH:quinone reductase-like Zn-dependent oxidoreductase